MAGVFISRGMSLGVPAGGFAISFGSDGTSTSSLTFHVHFDVCPTWCELAMTHLASAKSSCIARVEAWAGNNEDEKARVWNANSKLLCKRQWRQLSPWMRSTP